MRQEQPFFSIIVPTYNRPQQLAACLRSLACLSYPRDCFEIIVVDDGSAAPPEAVVAALLDQLDVTLLKQPHTGPATARNAGAARARGEFLAFTDDDCTPAPNWLQALAERSATRPDGAIGGRTLNALPANLYSSASQLLVDYLYAHYNANPDQAHFFASNNFALPTDRFHTIGGFNTTFPRAAGEDRELCDRWLRHGYGLAYAPEAVVYHAHTLTFSTFWRQQFHYGRGAFRFHHVRARRYQEQISLEPKAFYLRLLRYPFTNGHGLRALRLAVLFLMSQLAVMAGLVWERGHRSPSTLPSLSASVPHIERGQRR